MSATQESQDVRDGTPCLIDQPFVTVKFQAGPVKKNGVNGAQIEDLLDICISRLAGFNRGQFPCPENSIALTHLQEANMWLKRRTRARAEQGVEGEDVAHEEDPTA